MTTNTETDDPILARFTHPKASVGDEDVQDPAKPSEPEAQDEEEKESWLRYGKEYEVMNHVIVLYPIGALAEALGRKPVTVRSWEEKGWLPPTPIKGPIQGRNGKRRLYTRKMIEGIVQIAYEEGLMVDPRKVPHMDTTEFPERVHEFLEKVEIN